MVEHANKPFCESSRRWMLPTTAIRELSFIVPFLLKGRKGEREGIYKVAST